MRCVIVCACRCATEHSNSSWCHEVRHVVCVCVCIAAQHSKNIAHRDLKPENLLLTHGESSPSDSCATKEMVNPVLPCLIYLHVISLVGEQPVGPPDRTNLLRPPLTLVGQIQSGKGERVSAAAS